MIHVFLKKNKNLEKKEEATKERKKRLSVCFLFNRGRTYEDLKHAFLISLYVDPLKMNEQPFFPDYFCRIQAVMF